MHLSGLSPFGPIFGKELRTASRRRRNYFLRVAYLAALLLFLLMAYTFTRDSWNRAGAAQRAQEQEQLGWLFFMFFSMFCTIAMGLIGPVLTSTAINEERLRRTLHVLLMTPLTAWQIVSGKLFSRLLTALTLIGLSLPVLALVRLLGGVELQQMFGVIALAAVTALTSAALGLLLSVMLRRAYAVIILSYLIMVSVYFFIPLVMMALGFSLFRKSVISTGDWSTFNPFVATAQLASGMTRRGADSWMICVAVHLVLTTVMTVLAALLVRREARREGEAASPLPMALPPPLPMDGAGSPQPSALSATTARAGRTVSDYPILWRELRRPLMTRRWQRIAGSIVAGAFLGVVYLILYMNDGLGAEEVQLGFAVVFQTLGILFVCVISATAIAQEKEGDTWTVLLASPLSGPAIVWSKALGTARRLMWPTIFVLTHFVAFTIARVLSPLVLLVIVAVLISFNVIWIATGTYLSLRCRKVTVAVIINLALPVLLYIVLTMVVAVLDELGGYQEKLMSRVFWYVPHFYLTRAFQYRDATGVRLPSDLYVSMPTFTAIVLGVCMLHIGAAMGVLAWMGSRFDAIVARARQLDPMPPTLAKPSQRISDYAVSGS